MNSDVKTHEKISKGSLTPKKSENFDISDTSQLSHKDFPEIHPDITDADPENLIASLTLGDIDFDDEADISKKPRLADTEPSGDEAEKEPLSPSDTASLKSASPLGIRRFRDTSDGDKGLFPSVKAFEMGIIPDGFEEDPKEEYPSLLSESVEIKKKPASASKKPVRSPLLLLFITTIIFGLVYSSYIYRNHPVLRQFLNDIPYIRDLLGKQTEDIGKITVLEGKVRTFFAENSIAGKLFVIKGEVKNEYPGPRDYIKMTGKIYARGRVISQEMVYCGNLLSESELSELAPDTLKERLLNRAGNQSPNRRIESGKTIPYMIVFFSMPEHSEEFTVEVSGSSPSGVLK